MRYILILEVGTHFTNICIRKVQCSWMNFHTESNVIKNQQLSFQLNLTDLRAHDEHLMSRSLEAKNVALQSEKKTSVLRNIYEKRQTVTGIITAYLWPRCLWPGCIVDNGFQKFEKAVKVLTWPCCISFGYFCPARYIKNLLCNKEGK